MHMEKRALAHSSRFSMTIACGDTSLLNKIDVYRCESLLLSPSLSHTHTDPTPESIPSANVL